MESLRVLIEIGHPAHVHHFKNLIKELESRGHKIKICTTDKDVTIRLLENLGFEYELLGKNLGKSLFGKLKLILLAEFRMYQISKQFNPDIFVSRCSPISAQVSKIIGKPHISFNDTEHTNISDALAVPFTEAICVPSCFVKSFRGKGIRYNGYKELAYLHPKYFIPEPTVLKDEGIHLEEKFAILRLISWNAHHDINEKGIDDIIEFVKKLNQEIKVIISSEKKLPEELQKFAVKINPEKIHHLLYFASLYIGEGATMATEAAILGTPAVYISSLARTMGNFNELENEYGLLYSFDDSSKALGKAMEILNHSESKKEWAIKRNRMLDTKIDVTRFMVWFIENFPNSFNYCKENPHNEYTYNLK